MSFMVRLKTQSGRHEYYGPFPTTTAAGAWANRQNAEDWSVIPLKDPT